jgi:hypothetical protein
VIRKWFAEHGQELHPKHTLLIMAKAQMPAMVGPIVSDFLNFGARCGVHDTIMIVS